MRREDETRPLLAGANAWADGDKARATATKALSMVPKDTLELERHQHTTKEEAQKKNERKIRVEAFLANIMRKQATA